MVTPILCFINILFLISPKTVQRTEEELFLLILSWHLLLVSSQYSDHTHPQSVKVTISGNKADTAGTVLFGGDISNCLLFSSNQAYRSEYFNNTFDYSAQTGPSVISSEPTDVCFCDDNSTINCSQTQLTMTAYPGKEINISVVTVGQQNGVAPAILQIQPQDNADTSADMELHNTSAMNCSTIALKPIYKTYRLNVME